MKIMSDETKIEDPIFDQIKEVALEERKKKEVLHKELIVRERKVDSALEKIEQGDKNIEIAKKTNYGTLSEEEVLEKQRENTEYMHAARNKMRFINKSFDDLIP